MSKTRAERRAAEQRAIARRVRVISTWQWSWQLPWLSHRERRLFAKKWHQCSCYMCRPPLDKLSPSDLRRLPAPDGDVVAT